MGPEIKRRYLPDSLLTKISLLLVLMALALLSACAVNPVSGEQQLAFMSEDQELQMGKQYYPQTVQTFGGKVPQDDALQAYVNQVGQKLAKQSHRPDLPWEFTVVNDGMINAFALPGGKICITRGLITKMNSEDELAAVLGHEIGHVTARHAVSAHARSTLVNVGVAGVGIALSGTGFGSAGSQVAGLAGNLLIMSYSRDQERQSDELGYQYMLKNGYNPKGMVELFEIFKQQEKTAPSAIEGFFSSHPLTDERISTARSRVTATHSWITGKSMKTDEFSRALQTQKSRLPAYDAFQKGQALMKQKQYAEAVRSLERGISLFGKDGMMHSELAQAYFYLNQTDKARRAADEAARLSPDVFIPNYIAGAINLETNHPNQAVFNLQAASRVLPNHSGSKYLLGLAYEKSGENNNAISLYRQVVSMDPQGKAGQAAAARLNQMGYRP